MRVTAIIINCFDNRSYGSHDIMGEQGFFFTIFLVFSEIIKNTEPVHNIEDVYFEERLKSTGNWDKY